VASVREALAAIVAEAGGDSMPVQPQKELIESAA
jgi:hypothetical protein